MTIIHDFGKQKEKRETFSCSCSYPGHLLLFDWWINDDNAEEIYVHVSLADNGKWHERIRDAVKYVFGYRSKYGMFDEVILHRGEVERLQRTLAEAHMDLWGKEYLTKAEVD